MAELNHFEDQAWQSIVSSYSADAAREPKIAARHTRRGLMAGTSAALAVGLALAGCADIKSTHDVSSSQVTASAGGECAQVSDMQLPDKTAHELMDSGTDSRTKGWIALQEALQKETNSSAGIVGDVTFKLVYPSAKQATAPQDVTALWNDISTNLPQEAGSSGASKLAYGEMSHAVNSEEVFVVSGSYCEATN
ncbi:MAG TPA: hypothetical protein VIM53_00870 [Candidatus Saccharimonadales bacterium]